MADDSDKAPIYDPLEKHLKDAVERVDAAIGRLVEATKAVERDAPAVTERHELIARVDLVIRQHQSELAALENLLKQYRRRK